MKQKEQNIQSSWSIVRLLSQSLLLQFSWKRL